MFKFTEGCIGGGRVRGRERDRGWRKREKVR